eukprot:TRINITY_DN7315_c0_g6_i1.p1 TRINITY_DN7315_c0_g6~~TRINITY_DN7315_c0_g6_i1.p1  ORF type:complete len:110 (-),score=29.56 TRINITY_DN7315_c0_g6_i1:492-821(-)
MRTLEEEYVMCRSESTEKKKVTVKRKSVLSLVLKKSKIKQQSLYDLQEHAKNIKSLQYNLQRIDMRNIQERKKNPYDPIAYPSLFFRAKKDAGSVQLKYYQTPVYLFTS